MQFSEIKCTICNSKFIIDISNAILWPHTQYLQQKVHYCNIVYNNMTSSAIFTTTKAILWNQMHNIQQQIQNCENKTQSTTTNSKLWNQIHNLQQQMKCYEPKCTIYSIKWNICGIKCNFMSNNSLSPTADAILWYQIQLYDFNCNICINKFNFITSNAIFVTKIRYYDIEFNIFKLNCDIMILNAMLWPSSYILSLIEMQIQKKIIWNVFIVQWSKSASVSVMKIIKRGV